MARSCDVLVLGGGPAGSTAAILLARQGWKVTLLEKEHFPRFHIGESLLPFGNTLLQELGVWDDLVRGGFTVKPGADFHAGDGNGMLRSDFRRFLGDEFGRTFQVDRASFDHLLIRRAAAAGAEVHEGTRAEIEVLDETGVRVIAHGPEGGESWEARWLLDCTGRDAVLGRHLGLPKSDLGMEKKLAVYAHFRGVRRNDGPWEGNISIVRLEGGWFWIIPLREGITSVGLVQPIARYREAGGVPQEVFARACAASPEMRFRMKASERASDWHTTSDYTFRHHRTAGPRWVLCGDAAGFIDPIFSSGVRVAMQSAGHAAELVGTGLREGRPLRSPEQAAYHRKFTRMTGAFLRMIRMFYDNHGFEVFISASELLGIRRAVVDVVGGNTEPSWGVRWRQELFFLICRLQRWVRLAPRLPLFRSPVRPEAAPAP